MKPLRATLMIGLALSAAGWSPQGLPDLVIENVTIVDVGGDGLLPDRSVIVDGDRITAVRPSSEGGIDASRLIDGSGQYLLPGLWDAHAHLSYWGEDALARLVGWGVTTIREMGGDPDEVERWRHEVARGERLGPRIFWSGPFLEGPEGEERYRRVVADPAEARTAAIELLDRGVDFLKIQPAIGAAEVVELVRVATERNTIVVGHVPAGLSPIEAVELGLRSVDHIGAFLQLDDEQVDATIDVFLEHEASLAPDLYSWVAQLEANGESRRDSGRIRRAFEIVRRFDDAGVPLLVGANFAFRDWPHEPGAALHGEMQILVEAGLEPADVLRMVTLGNAGFLDVPSDRVRVQSGARADLLLLEADPLARIEHTRLIEGIVIAGRYLDSRQAAALRRRPR